jgi:hypothetical protein
MNRLKFLLDVIQTMKEQEKVKGAFRVEATRDQVKVFNLESQFEKDMLTGKGQSKIKTAFDCDGQQLSHESSTEFTNIHKCHGGLHRRFREHLHGRAGWLRRQGDPAAKCGGLKEKLNHIAILLQVLEKIQLEEQPDRSYVLSLKSADFPADLKRAVIEQMRERREAAREHLDADHFEGCALIRELHDIQEAELEFQMGVNRDNKVSWVSISIAIEGITGSEAHPQTGLTLRAELDLD